MRTTLKVNLVKFLLSLLVVQQIGIALPIINVANAADPTNVPTPVTASRASDTGVITVTWPKSADGTITGYKVVIFSAGDKYLSTIVAPTSSATQTLTTCYPYSGTSSVSVTTTTSTVPNPTYTGNNSSKVPSESYWTTTSGINNLGGKGSVCTSSATYDYSITFNGNNETGGTTASQSGRASLIKLNLNGFANSTYSFGGWCQGSQPALGSRCTGTRYADGADITLSATFTVTLYAIWLNSTSYAVTYNGNGGSDTVSNIPTNSNLYNTNDTFTVGSSIPLRSGYTFNGWNDNNAGTGTLYKFGTSTETYTVGSADIDFYGAWLANKYTYNPNTGTGAAVDQVFASETLVAITNPFTAPSGYSFAGWCTAIVAVGTETCTGSDTKYLSGSNLPDPGSPIINLYALWKSAPAAPPAPIYVPTPPSITSISAPEVCAIGSQLIITGINLGGVSVAVDGVAGQILSASYSSILISLPARPIGTKTIVVSNFDGTASTTVKYKFVESPVYVNYIYPETFKNKDFSYTFKATGTEKYSITGTMPAGLTLNPLTGELSGAPTVEGDFVFTIVASNICDDAYLNVYMFVDKAIPDTFTCNLAFPVPKSDTISDYKLSQLKTCLDKIKVVTPKYIDPIIYLSGGLPVGLSAQEALVSPRYVKIIDFIKSIGLNYQIYVGAFGGTTDTVQLNVYWPST